MGKGQIKPFLVCNLNRGKPMHEGYPQTPSNYQNLAIVTLYLIASDIKAENHSHEMLGYLYFVKPYD
jgi:hypothetical protein